MNKKLILEKLCIASNELDGHQFKKEVDAITVIMKRVAQYGQDDPKQPYDSSVWLGEEEDDDIDYDKQYFESPEAHHANSQKHIDWYRRNDEMKRYLAMRGVNVDKYLNNSKILEAMCAAFQLGEHNVVNDYKGLPQF